MAIRTSGTGSNKLAIVGVSETDKEAFSGEHHQGIEAVRKGLGHDGLEDTLRVQMFAHGEKVTDAGARGDAVNAMLQDMGITTVIPVGAAALKALSPIHGNIRMMVGSTIEANGLTYIPIGTVQTDMKAFRDWQWTLEQTRLVKRAALRAAGKVPTRQFQSMALGQGPDVEAALEKLIADRTPVGVDLETFGPDHHRSVITAVGLSNAHVGVSTPWAAYRSHTHGDQRGLTSQRVEALIRAILADDRITKLFHNGAFDLTIFKAQQIAVGGPCHDTLLAHKVLFGSLFHNLQFVASHEFAIAPWKTIFKMGQKQRGEPAGNRWEDWSEMEPTALLTYNFQDAAVLPMLWDRLSGRLDRYHHGWELYNHLVERAANGAERKYHGVNVDQQARMAITQQVKQQIGEVESEWARLHPGIPYSGPGSKKAIETLLFKTLGAPVISRSKTTGEPSLPSSTLLEYDIMGPGPLAETAFTLFRLRKARKSYDAFLKPLESGEEVVYAEPNISGTKGTRESCSKPNVQQWAKEKEIHRKRDGKFYQLSPNLRPLLVPAPGHVMIELDYSALEARMFAHDAGIPDWLEEMDKEGGDLHVLNAKRVFGRKLDKKKPEDAKLRQIVKTLTFARFYNKAGNVDQVLKALKPAMPDLTEKYLKTVFDAMDKGIPEIVRWQERRDAFVKKHGFTETELLPLRQYHNPQRPDSNQHYSFRIQSSCGNVVNLAMLRMDKRFDKDAGQRIIAQIHDALLVQARPEHVRWVYHMVKEEMERPIDMCGKTGIILPVEGGWGYSWKDAHRPITELPCAQSI